MTVDDALALLQLESAETAAQVTLAYRQRALAVHPDRGGDPHAAGERMLLLKQARAVLEHQLRAQQRQPCRQCGGKGFVMFRTVVAVPCDACAGTGVSRHS